MAMEPGGSVSSGQTASSSGPQPPHLKQGCTCPPALQPVRCQVPWDVRDSRCSQGPGTGRSRHHQLAGGAPWLWPCRPPPPAAAWRHT